MLEVSLLGFLRSSNGFSKTISVQNYFPRITYLKKLLIATWQLILRAKLRCFSSIAKSNYLKLLTTNDFMLEQIKEQHGIYIPNGIKLNCMWVNLNTQNVELNSR